MCGILIHKDLYEPGFNIDHRGIKGNKIELNEFVFNHRSLPLQTNHIKLSQPVTLDNGNLLLFNGEIFNVSEISKYDNDLQYLKWLFKKGVPKNIAKEMNKWDGFWSIVFYNARVNTFTCITDPLGKKQLYYSDKGICSEIKPLIEKGRDFLYSQNQIGTNKTMFSYIFRMIPGRIYEIEGMNLMRYRAKTYYEVNRTRGNIIKAMDQSIKRRMINKIDNVSLFLSGGLDSTILLDHLSRLGMMDQLDILTVDNYEDLEVVEKLSKEYSFDYRKVPMNNIDDDLEEIVRSYEHPTDLGSLIPQWYLTKAAENRVILTGDGADELFGGYKRSLENDTFSYDVYMELPYFHHLRLDRVSMNFTKELRNPFLSKEMLEIASMCSIHDRKGKTILLDKYKDRLPDYVIGRKKKPLRNKESKEINQKMVLREFSQIFNKYSKKR
jgi:asparagine synthase (glutamine-hydrolysing)